MYAFCAQRRHLILYLQRTFNYQTNGSLITYIGIRRPKASKRDVPLSKVRDTRVVRTFNEYAIVNTNAPSSPPSHLYLKLRRLQKAAEARRIVFPFRMRRKLVNYIVNGISRGDEPSRN